MTKNGQTYQDGYIKWLRSHVGHELIYLVYTTAFIFDDNGHLLVQERYDFDWLSVPGGALEMNESLADCIKRETFEETGIDCTIERLVGVFSHPQYNLLYPNGDQVQPWTVAFVCKASHSDIRVDGQETLEAKFRPPHEIYDRLPLQYQDMLRAIEDSTTEAVIEPIYYESELRPYYPILREKIGTDRVILPGTTGVIFNEDGHILAVHDKQRDIWDIPAGLSDIGETSSGTVVRELQEETGLTVKPIRNLGVYSHPNLSHAQLDSGDKAHWVDLILECEIVGGTPTPDGVEIDDIQYMSIEQLLAEPDITPLRKQILTDIQNRHQAPFIR
jgi:8-oxo-dGTP pyrophosphatase MutT (NUDIX family)